MSHSPPHQPGRGCPCTRCVKRRAASKAYYHRKKNGETSRGRATPQQVEEKRIGHPRFFESKTADDTVVHWMPKERSEWMCPVCGVCFIKVGEEWQRTRVA